MKVVQGSKLQDILSCFIATNNHNKDNKSILRNHKTHRKLHFSVPIPIRTFFCFGNWTSIEDSALERKELLRCSLHDLFVSSPPEPSDHDQVRCSGKELVFGARIDVSGRMRRSDINDGSGMYRRFRFANIRHRLLRRPWRPALVAIPE